MRRKPSRIKSTRSKKIWIPLIGIDPSDLGFNNIIALLEFIMIVPYSSLWCFPFTKLIFSPLRNKLSTKTMRSSRHVNRYIHFPVQHFENPELML